MDRQHVRQRFGNLVIAFSVTQIQHRQRRVILPQPAKHLRRFRIPVPHVQSPHGVC